ncbi:MAG TPA: hypothetical protein VK155_05155 [Bacteroidales bacterium]|nr:hypothetical protein [Bacteroidales bacterium]
MNPIVQNLIILMLALMVRNTAGQNHGELIFQSGFEQASTVVPLRADADISGSDKSVKNHNDWVNDLDNNPFIGNFNLQYQGGDSTQRYAAIVPEPGNPSNHVLKFWLNEPNVNGSKGRIQANIYGNKGLYGFTQSVRVFLHDDFNTVRTYPDKISWLTISEFWNNITWDQKVPYRFRITLGIGKPVKEESDLYFIIDAEDCQLFENGRQRYDKVWAEINKDVKVPIGKWFTMEYYYKEGNAETGRFYMSVTPEGGKKQVIFDLKKFTHNTEDPAPDGVGDYNPMKLYTSKGLIDYMHSKGKTLQIFWDDFGLWKDKR